MTVTVLPATKRCPRCGREKRACQFHRDRHNADGLYRLCKQCRRPLQAASAKRRRAKRGAYTAAYDREFPTENRDRKARARAAQTPEERRERWRWEYHQRDKAGIAARVRERRRAARETR